MTLLPGSKLGPYEIVSPLGAGGMGEVYRARDPRLGREIALKVLPEDVSADRDRLARFEQEARSASGLNHPNIITVYEVGRSDGTSFIAMELVEGKTLREVSASGPLPIKRVVSIGAQVAEGLAKAHAAGIVHRDLKPENLMVSRDGYVKILDFGLSKLVAPESGGLSGMPTLAKPDTQPGTVLGTVAYMSPEQASGQPVDFRSDQFTLGSILYEIASGQKAFQQKTAAETMSSIIREEPEPLGNLRPEIPPPLRWIIERCLAKDPEERYASTRDLARDLAGVRDHISEVGSSAEVFAAAPQRGRRVSLPLAAAALIGLAALLAGWAAARLWRWKAPAAAPSFHRLTFRRGLVGNARFAPDGHTILYGAWWEGTPGMQLYLTRPESPESRAFDFPPGTDILAISSSGELALLLGEGTGRTTLARAPLAGGVPRQVLEGVGYGNADWSPDAKQLVVVRKSPSNKQRLEFPMGMTLFEAAGAIESPRFSPRGDRIAFFEYSSSSAVSVSVIGSSGKGKRKLSEGWTSTTGIPGWTPDGREVWFTAASAGRAQALYAVDLSGKQRLVTRVPGNLELYDISRDGLVLVGHHSTRGILMGLASGELKERDLAWLDDSSFSDLSADGATLLLTESGEGSGQAPSVYLRKTDGSPAVRLGEGTGIALSPDQKWVLACATPAGQAPKLVLQPTGPGEARTLATEGFVNFGGAYWSNNGKDIVFSGVEQGHRSRIYLLDVEGGKPRAISPEGVTLRPRTSPLSPDGKLVIGTQEPATGSSAVRLYPLESGEPLAVPGVEALEYPVQWSADGGSLYVYRGGPTGSVWLLDRATGVKKPWREFRAPLATSGINFRVLMTRDGKSYVYGYEEIASELYLVEGLK